MDGQILYFPVIQRALDRGPVITEKVVNKPLSADLGSRDFVAARARKIWASIKGFSGFTRHFNRNFIEGYKKNELSDLDDTQLQRQLFEKRDEFDWKARPGYYCALIELLEERRLISRVLY